MTTPRKPKYSTAAHAAARGLLPLGVAVLAISANVALAGTAHAATTSQVVKVTAGDDGYVSSARPTYGFGGNPSLIAGTVKGDRMHSYLKFTVAALPAGTKVSKVELKLTREAGKNLPASVKLKQVATSTWSQTTLKYGNAPAVGAEVAAASPAPTAATVSFDLTSVVKGPGTYTFAVTSPATNAIARFRSAETGAQAPALHLTVTKTPTPTPTPPPTPTPTPTPAPCTVDAKLVPSCNVLWGAAAGGFSDTPRDQALREWEAKSGRTAAIYHTYHRGDEMFPTTAEIAMTREAGKPRVLMTNWKVAYGTTWAKVAAGGQDARIDKLAAHIKANYTDTFFLVLHHEPENDVNTDPAAGMTAKNYAAMFRHTVTRLKAQGVSNAVFVMAYMNYEKWNNSPWWAELYPGDDVVDWVGVDTYNNAQPGGFHYGDFKYMMDRTTDKAKFPGWYTWATTQHPGKPIMVAEWGVYDSSTTIDPTNRAKVFDTVVAQLKQMPAIKGMVYFDTASDQSGHDIRIDATPQSLDAFKRVAADPMFNVKLR